MSIFRKSSTFFTCSSTGISCTPVYPPNPYQKMRHSRRYHHKPSESTSFLHHEDITSSFSQHRSHIDQHNNNDHDVMVIGEDDTAPIPTETVDPRNGKRVFQGLETFASWKMDQREQQLNALLQSDDGNLDSMRALDYDRSIPFVIKNTFSTSSYFHNMRQKVAEGTKSAYEMAANHIHELGMKEIDDNLQKRKQLYDDIWEKFLTEQDIAVQELKHLSNDDMRTVFSPGNKVKQKQSSILKFLTKIESSTANVHKQKRLDKWLHPQVTKSIRGNSTRIQTEPPLKSLHKRRLTVSQMTFNYCSLLPPLDEDVILLLFQTA